MNKLSKLIAVSVVGLSTSAMAVTFVASANAKNFEISGVQAAKLDTRNEGGSTPGNAFYVMDYTYNDDYSKQWYVGNGRNVWAHFWNTADTSKSVDVNLGSAITFSYNYDDHDRRVVEGRVPEYPAGITSWNRVLLVRVDTSYDHIVWPSDDSTHASNQTGDIVLTNSTSINAIRVHGDAEHYDNYVSAAGRIEKWAEGTGEWNNSGLCVQNGSTDATALKTSWDKTADTYEDIKGDDVKAFFSNQTPVETGSTCEQLAYRYDHILSKHPTWNDFAHRL